MENAQQYRQRSCSRIGNCCNNSTPLKPDFMYIHVFKTNLNDSRRIQDIEPSLDMHPDVIEWNVDLQDTDNILRVVSSIATTESIEQAVLSAGYYCEELV